jgi:DNA polymerase-3 subunit epsilon
LESYDWAFEAYLSGAVFTACDIETTGLDPKVDRIVEFGAVKFDRMGLIIRYSVLMNPGIPMPEAALRVNGISDEMLAGKPPLEAVLPEFLRFVKDAVLVAHNAQFDCGFVNEKLGVLHERAKKKGASQGDLLLDIDESGDAELSGWVPPFPVLPNRIADTLLITRRVFPNRGKYNLQDLAAGLKISTANAHRAEDDALVCMKIFICCCEAAKSTV